MERRKVLKSASAVATASTIGLAGCSGITGGGGGAGCAENPDDLADALPDSDEYEQREGMGTTEFGGEQENIEEGAVGLYTDSDDNSYFFTAVLFSSEDVAEEEASNVSQNQGQSESDSAVGYIVSGTYGYAAGGPDEDSVESFMATSSALSSDCVSNNIEFA